jgi:ribosomal protein S18 acetylase RimI-like enzyme
LKNFAGSIEFFSGSDAYRCCIDKNGYFYDAVSDDGKPRDTSSAGIYELGIVEEEDLPDLCRFVVATFGADAINLSSDMSNFERMLMNPAVELLNSYSSLVAFAEVFSGTKERLLDRIQGHGSMKNILAPDLSGLTRKEKICKAERGSLILILARPVAPSDKSSSSVDIIASIELRLQPCDAKIPFSIPWLDRVERRLGSFIGLGTEAGSADLQPYLSNLCVDEKYRGQKIGRALVRCVEDITRTCWGYSRMYLHVDEDNLPALNLYKSEGYRDVGHRWNPFWSGKASDIGYYVKTLSPPSQ